MTKSYDSIDPTTVDWQVEDTTDPSTIANMSKGDLGAALIQSRILNRGLRAQVEGLQQQARNFSAEVKAYESMVEQLEQWLRDNDDQNCEALVEYLTELFDLTITREWDVYAEVEIRGTATVTVTVEAKTEDEARSKVADDMEGEQKVADAVADMSVFDFDEWDVERYDVTEVNES